jgi:hypothetical protein
VADEADEAGPAAITIPALTSAVTNIPTSARSLNDFHLSTIPPREFLGISNYGGLAIALGLSTLS